MQALSDVFWGDGAPNIVLGPSFCMAISVSMCEQECYGMVLRSPVYSACRVVLMLRGVG